MKHHQKDAFAPLRFYEGRFVFNTHSGVFYRVTPEATFILKALIRGKDARDIAKLLQDEYDLDRGTSLRDAALFINRLAQLELLPEQGDKT